MRRIYLLGLALAACAPSQRPATAASRVTHEQPLTGATEPAPRPVSPPNAATPQVLPTDSAPPTAPRSASATCRADSDCVLLSRGSLGCCAQCATLAAMTHAERAEMEQLCGLHNGGETCPPLDAAERAACTPDDPAHWRAVCRAGACEKVTR